jgi:hypothetical protein
MEGGYYHITSRGVAGQETSCDDEDREVFLDKVEESHQRWGRRILRSGSERR